MANRFELRLNALGAAANDGQTANEIRLITEIWIDGRYLDEPHPINLIALMMSIHHPGSHYIFTCECGISDCAGIPEGVVVLHSENKVVWRMRRPQSYRSTPELSISAWEASASWFSFEFDRDQMMASVCAYLIRLRHTIRHSTVKVQWPILGFDLEAIFRIDPRHEEGVFYSPNIYVRSGFVKLFPSSDSISENDEKIDDAE